MLSDVFRTADHALELLLHRAASVNPWLCALGIVLYIGAQAVRPRGWHTIIKSAYPDADGLRPRHTTAAYLAGAGLNGIIPARGGDIVKLWLLHRRIPGARYPTLAATFVPETLFETLFGFGLVIWALSQGFLPVPTSSGELPHVDVTLLIEHPVLSGAGTLLLAAIAYGIYRLLRRRIGDLTARRARACGSCTSRGASSSASPAGRRWAGSSASRRSPRSWRPSTCRSRRRPSCS
jgi:uncharacterized membrane protein YbhN (UPF0104 family)